MNKAYRLIWNEFTSTWVAVSEIVKARGKRASGSVLLAAAGFIAVPPAPTFAAPPNPPAATALPSGGQLVAGQATIAPPVNNALTITQTSQRAAIDWQTFNIGSAASVNFIQPSSSAAVLNRVLDANPSQIFGKINANGQVFLTNSSGIYFGRSASVNVGALTATTHSISNADFMAGNLNFTRNGATGKVENDGNITAELGGYIALLAPEVRNNGVIIAQGGTVALAAGEAFELQFDGARLANIRVEPATIAALVENGNAVHAPGGLIILSAQAANRLQGGVINNTGSLEATGLIDNGGMIRLTASDRINHTGSINVDAAPGKVGAGGTALLIANLTNPDSVADINGTISARGGDLGGNGGFIETSGGRVNIGSNTRVDTRAPQGKTGLWLLDPTDFTIATSGGNETGASVSASLSTTDRNITVADNIHVNDNVSWSANKLTLTATSGDININAVMTASGTSSLDLEPGSGNVNVGFDTGGTFKGRVDFPGRFGTGFLTISGNAYTVINSLGVLGDATGGTNQTLQGMARTANLTGYYALGSNIDASATGAGAWYTAGGFQPIGSPSGNFTGTFDGLGHTINKLTINRPTIIDIGLFGYGSSASVVRNIGLQQVNVTGNEYVGGLMGYSYGKISNSYVTGNVTGNNSVGGLMGYGNYATINNSHAAAKVTGTADLVGGLLGGDYGGSTISNVYASGDVSGSNFVGGLIGRVGSSNYSSTLDNAYASGNVSGVGYVGGLLGQMYADVTNVYAIGNVSASTAGVNAIYVGGLVGRQSYGSITNAFASGNVQGGEYVGGLVGRTAGNITNAFATGNVTGTGGKVASLVGWHRAIIDTAYATGTVNGGAALLVGAGSDGTDTNTVTGFPSTVTTNNFTGDVDNTWTNAGNWDGGHAPTIFETAALPFDSSVSIPQNVMAWDVTTQNEFSFHFTGGNVSSLTIGKNTAIDLGNTINFNFNTSGKLNLPSAPTLAFNGDIYTVIRDLGAQGSVTGIDLQGINKDGTSLAEKYVLGLDINASATSTWNTGSGFLPLGRNAGGQEFSGTLDGLGHSVNHLTINRPTTNDVGLFGFVSVGSLRNVGLIDATVTGQSTVGSLVGTMFSGVIENVFATGTVSGSQSSVGGLIGQAGVVTIANANAAVTVSGEGAVGGLLGNGNGTTIIQSRATSIVTGSGSSGGSSIGGLVGSITQGTITDSYATGTVDVLGGYSKVGGLVGTTDSSSITNSWATGNVGTASSGLYTNVGGLVGYGFNSNISGSHASGNVVGGSYTGGLVGNFIVYGYGADKSGDINNSYATGAVTGANFVGGLVGGAISSASSYGTASASMQFADVYATGAVVGVGSYVGGLVGFAKGSSSNGNSDGSGFALAILAISNAYASGSVSGISGSCGSGGCGNEVGGLVGHFESEASSSGDFSRANVTITTSKASGVVNGVGDMVGGLVGYGKSGSSGAGMSIMSIGRSYASGNVTGVNNVGGLVGNTYVGTGGGGGANLDINQTYATGNVTGTDNVGGLVGNGYYVGISKSFATGAVNGHDFVGGLVGQSGHVSLGQSFATGDVNGNRLVGGLVGYGYLSDIANVYASGNVVSATGYVGGLIGVAAYGTISNTFASGLVTATTMAGGSAAGGLLGNDDFGYGPPIISNSFFDQAVNASLNGVGNNASATGVAGKTSTELKTAATFTGWSLRSTGTPSSTPEIWRIYEGNTTPLLVAFLTPLNIVTSTPTTVATSFWHPNPAVNSSLIQTGGNSNKYSAQYTDAQRIAGAQFMDYDLTSMTSAYLRLITGSSIYGDTPSFTYGLYTASSGGTVISDASPTGSVTWSTSLSATSAANTYAEHYVSGITLGNSTYSLSVGSDINWLINPRPLTLTAGSTSRYYGSVNPTVTAFAAPTGTNGSGSGLINGDSISSVTNTIAGTATATANAATTHGITPSAPIFSAGTAGNYAITYVDGVLSISQRPISVTAVNQSRVYGDANPTSGTVTLSSGTLATSDALSTATVSSSAISTTAAGQTAALTPSVQTFSAGTAGNYAITYVDGVLSISQRPISVTAVNQSRVYGDANPTSGTVTLSSGTLATSDALSTATVSSSAISTTAAGQTAALTPSVQTFSAGTAGNYAITYVDGVLSISRRPITVTAEAKNKTEGASDPVLTYLSEALSAGRGLMSGESLLGALIRLAGETAGTYAIQQGTVDNTSNGNYTITYVGDNLTIALAGSGGSSGSGGTPPVPPTIVPPPPVIPPISLPMPVNAPPPLASLPPSGPSSGPNLIPSSGSSAPLTTSGGDGPLRSGAPDVPASGPTGGVDSQSGASGGSGAAGPTSAGVSVSLVRQPSSQDTGIITVSVPKEMATAGSGFTFPLPSQVAEIATAANIPIRVTTTSGGELPSWLRYLPETQSFVASAVPDGAFPIQVIVTVGGTRTTVVISERAEK
jgi:filamentous hemagglutinin family protein